MSTWYQAINDMLRWIAVYGTTVYDLTSEIFNAIDYSLISTAMDQMTLYIVDPPKPTIGPPHHLPYIPQIDPMITVPTSHPPDVHLHESPPPSPSTTLCHSLTVPSSPHPIKQLYCTILSPDAPTHIRAIFDNCTFYDKVPDRHVPTLVYDSDDSHSSKIDDSVNHHHGRDLEYAPRDAHPRHHGQYPHAHHYTSQSTRYDTRPTGCNTEFIRLNNLDDPTTPTRTMEDLIFPDYSHEDQGDSSHSHIVLPFKL